MVLAATCGLSKEYIIDGEKVQALANVDFTIAAAEIVAIVGKSGCGKTTLLRILGGLEEPSAGHISFAAPYLRVGMVFQEPRLMPWLTVEQNIAFAAKGVANNIKEQQVSDLLQLLGLTDFPKAYPAQLSGGMAQRVALGRALFYRPDLILMDEPLSALDAFTRRNLQEELVHIFTQARRAVVFVTHDIEEAIILGNRIIIMEEGYIKHSVDVPFAYPRNRSDVAFQDMRHMIMDFFE